MSRELWICGIKVYHSNSVSEIISKSAVGAVNQELSDASSYNLTFSECSTEEATIGGALAPLERLE